MLDRNTSIVAEFGGNERGAIAVVFALVLVPLIAVVSLSIDYGRALSVKSQITSAADAATAALLHKLPAPMDELRPFVRRQLDANLPDHLKELPFELDFSEKARRIQLSLQTEIPTALIGIVGITKLEIAVVSTQIMPRATVVVPGLGGFKGRPPANLHEAERALRDAVGALDRRGGSAPVPTRTPSPEELAKLREEINRQVQDALARAGHGNTDFGAIRDALRR